MRLSNLKSVLALIFCTLALFAFTFVPICRAQDTSGMTGTVTDQSGAAIPGATVVLTNVATGAKYTQVTNSIGAYRFAQIPPGVRYLARITAKGFAAVTINNVSLLVGQVRTQNVSMSVGTQVSTVEVTASNAVVTLDTTDALVGNNLDPEQLNNLPVQQRNDPLALFAMQPGVTDSGSVTGARVDQNDVTVDGLDVNDFATGGASQGNAGSGISTSLGTIVGHAPIDSVEQFQGNVAGNQASTGPAAGGQFALVTKSGTNHFHGDLNEYHRDTSLTANSWFSNDANPIVPRQHLIHNQFGGAIGGPILRNKAFFFFDFNDSKIVAGAVESRTVPSPSLRAGSIVYCNAPKCASTNTLTMSQVNAFDPAGIGVDQNWLNFINKRFPVPNQSGGGDGLNSLGYTFNAPNNDNETNYVSRIDYRINPNMSLWGRFTITREDSVYQPNQFPGDPVTSPFTDRSYAFVIGHDWVIGQNKTNRVFLGETVQKVGFPIEYNPGGSTAYSSGDGADKALTSVPYIWPTSQARRVPNEQLGDDFSLIKGRHTWQFGGVLKDILAHSTNVTDYNIAEIGLGGHIFSLCSSCGAGNPSLRPSDLDLANKFTWDEPFAFLLGRIGNVTSTYNYDAKGDALKQLTGDQRFYRYYQTQFYVQDSWKVFPSLTLTYGITYQWFSVPYETRGLETVEPTTFNQFFGARVQQSATGATTVPLISYLLGGKANGSGAPPLYNPEYRNFAPHLGFAWNPGFDKKLVINGSAGIVYDRTVINAIQYIQDGYSYLFQQQKQNNYGTSGDPYDSIKNDKRLDANSQLTTVTLTPPSTPRPPYQPFTGSQCAGQNYSPCGLQIGVFNSTIDPSLQTPYNMVFNFGVQRQLPWNMLIKANYVSRLGRKLIAQEDASQVLDFVDPVSGEKMTTAFASITQQTRQGVEPQNLTVQPWFENVVTPGIGVANGYGSNTEYVAAGNSSFVYNGDFGDFVWAISPNTPPNVGEAAQFANNDFYTNAGFSTYHALLLTLQKNLSGGLHYDFNYTWSHSIDNTSFFANSMGDTGIGGIGLVCDAVHPRECRSNSDFDTRNYITSDATYQLPFGKGRMFVASSSRLVDEIIGGWDLSGLATWHQGFPWSATSNAFVASFSNDAPPIFIGSDRKSIQTHVTKQPDGSLSIFKDPNKASQQFEGPVGLQIGPRNSFRGPGFFNMDAGLAKNFPIYKESVNLKFRADAFNVLNHPNFQVPAENVYNGYDAQDFQQGAGFGQINFTVTPSGNENDGARVLQLSLRLEF
jgi:hypothetical protein